MAAFYVEILTKANRKRRYSAPLFLSPTGLVTAFPEIEEDCFPDHVTAKKTANSKVPGENYRVGRLFNLLQSSRYQSWRAKVKGCNGFKEPRTPFLENWELYLQGGWRAMRLKYTKAHALQLVKHFIGEGLLDAKEEILQRFSAVEAESPEFWELVPLIHRADTLGVQEICISKHSTIQILCSPSANGVAREYKEGIFNRIGDS